MAKNSITDYDNTAANNTDVQSVDISEGCSPSGINNAIREVMADLADVNDGTVTLTSPQAGSLTVTGDLTVDTDTLFVDASADKVGIGDSTPSYTLDVAGDINFTGTLRQNGTAFSSGSAVAPTQVFVTSSGTVTIPSGKTKARFIAAGAGGGGASRNQDGSAGGTTTVTGTSLSLSAAGGAGGFAAYRALADGSALPAASGGTINRKSGGGQGGQGSLPAYDQYQPQNGQDGALAEKIITVVPAATYTVTIGSGGSGGSGNVSDDGTDGENGFVIVEYFDE